MERGILIMVNQFSYRNRSHTSSTIGKALVDLQQSIHMAEDDLSTSFTFEPDSPSVHQAWESFG